MNQANKLPLVIKGLQMLTSQLNENDRVSIAVYAGAGTTNDAASFSCKAP